MIHTIGPNDMAKPARYMQIAASAEHAGVLRMEQRAEHEHRHAHDEAAEDQQRLAPHFVDDQHHDHGGHAG